MLEPTSFGKEVIDKDQYLNPICLYSESSNTIEFDDKDWIRI